MGGLPQAQTNRLTYLGRYWTEHSVLRRYIPSDQNIKLLSFGCSTGEELCSLQALFPSAKLFGCDHDWQALQIARGLLGNAALIFESQADQIVGNGPYDVIVCNSVLLQPTGQYPEGARGIDPVLWSDLVSMLVEVLRPGGILQIINSNIPFRCHALASQFIPLRSPLILCPNFVDQFYIEGQHLCTGVPGVGVNSLLRSHWGEERRELLKPSDLDDVHFLKQGSAANFQPVNDESLPNMRRGNVVATGTASYRPTLTVDARPCTYLETEIRWTAFAHGDVHIDRTARRVWFDGSEAWTSRTNVDLADTDAGAFLEAMTGHRSTRFALDAIMAAKPVRSPYT